MMSIIQQSKNNVLMTPCNLAVLLLCYMELNIILRFSFHSISLMFQMKVARDHACERRSKPWPPAFKAKHALCINM